MLKSKAALRCVRARLVNVTNDLVMVIIPILCRFSFSSIRLTSSHVVSCFVLNPNNALRLPGARLGCSVSH